MLASMLSSIFVNVKTFIFHFFFIRMKQLVELLIPAYQIFLSYQRFAFASVRNKFSEGKCNAPIRYKIGAPDKALRLFLVNFHPPMSASSFLFLSSMWDVNFKFVTHDVWFKFFQLSEAVQNSFEFISNLIRPGVL